MKLALKRYHNIRVYAVSFCLLLPFCVQADVVDPIHSWSNSLTSSLKTFFLLTVCALVVLHLLFCMIGYWRLSRKKEMHFCRVIQISVLGSEVILLSSLWENHNFAPSGILCMTSCLLFQIVMSLIGGGWFCKKENIEPSKTKFGNWLMNTPSASKTILLFSLGICIVSCLLCLSRFQNIYEEKQALEHRRYIRPASRIHEPEDYRGGPHAPRHTEWDW